MHMIYCVMFYCGYITSYCGFVWCHCNDVTMGPMASPITCLTLVYSTVYSGADQRKQQSSASLAFTRRIHRWPVNSPHIGPVTRKMFPFDDVIIRLAILIRLLDRGQSKRIHDDVIKRKHFSRCWPFEGDQRSHGVCIQIFAEKKPTIPCNLYSYD